MSEAQQLLKMTPVLPERAQRGHTISEDEQLEGYLDHAMIFTDISTGKEKSVRSLEGEREDELLQSLGLTFVTSLSILPFHSLSLLFLLPFSLSLHCLIPSFSLSPSSSLLSSSGPPYGGKGAQWSAQGGHMGGEG